jgi:hypothetical protein
MCPYLIILNYWLFPFPLCCRYKNYKNGVLENCISSQEIRSHTLSKDLETKGGIRSTNRPAQISPPHPCWHRRLFAMKTLSHGIVVIVFASRTWAPRFESPPGVRSIHYDAFVWLHGLLTWHLTHLDTGNVIRLLDKKTKHIFQKTLSFFYSLEEHLGTSTYMYLPIHMYIYMCT